MFRVLSNLVQCVGTLFLLVGLVFQIYSLNSNKWITWTTDTNEGLSYFEGIFVSMTNDHTICVGLWNRCTIQQNSPVLQWVCWKWTLSIAKDGGPSPLATPIRYFTVVVILIVVYMSFLRTDIIVLRSVAPLPSIITCRIIRRLRSSFTHSARSMIPFCRCRHH